MTKKHRADQSKSMMVNDVMEKYEVTPGNPFAMAGKAQRGVPASAFFDLLEISGFHSTELADLLDLSFKTIQRYQKEEKKFNALNSEQLLKLIALYQKAEEVFGSTNAFNRWLQKPSVGLEIERPFNLLQTPGGIDLIYDELCRIEHGSLA